MWKIEILIANSKGRFEEGQTLNTPPWTRGSAGYEVDCWLRTKTKKRNKQKSMRETREKDKSGAERKREMRHRQKDKRMSELYFTRVMD